ADQCLPPGTLVQTPTGPVDIASVKVGDTVCGTAGSHRAAAGRVTAVKPGTYRGPLVRIEAEGGHVLRGTPHHVVPARIVDGADGDASPRFGVVLTWSPGHGYLLCAGALASLRRMLDPDGKAWLVGVR